MTSQNDLPANGGRRRSDRLAKRHRGAASELSQQIVRERFADIVAQNFDPVDLRPTATIAPVARAHGPRDWPASDEVIALEDAESHFTPPQPTAVLSHGSDPLRRLATFGAVGGPVLAILGLVLWAALGASALVIGILWFSAITFLASLIVLLWRMPSHRSVHHDDDGAVV